MQVVSAMPSPRRLAPSPGGPAPRRSPCAEHAPAVFASPADAVLVFEAADSPDAPAGPPWWADYALAHPAPLLARNGLSLHALFEVEAQYLLRFHLHPQAGTGLACPPLGDFTATLRDAAELLTATGRMRRIAVCVPPVGALEADLVGAMVVEAFHRAAPWVRLTLYGPGWVVEVPPTSSPV